MEQPPSPQKNLPPNLKLFKGVDNERRETRSQTTDCVQWQIASKHEDNKSEDEDKKEKSFLRKTTPTQVRRTSSSSSVYKREIDSNKTRDDTQLPTASKIKSIGSMDEITPRSESRRLTFFSKLRTKHRKSVCVQNSSHLLEETVLAAEEQFMKEKENSKRRVLNRFKEADNGIEDDGTDYGDALYNVPNIPRVIVMSGESHYYEIRAATIYKLIERLTCLIPEFFEECKFNQFLNSYLFINFFLKTMNF